MWADNEADLDLLGFDFLVDALVVALTEPRLLPLTVGVLGDWGSGKSSLMHLAADELGKIPRHSDSSTADAQGLSPYLTIDFSPWQYEDHQDVKVALMTTVLDELAKRLPDASAEIGRLRSFVMSLKRWGRRTGRAGTSVAPTVVPIVLQAVAPGTDPSIAAAVATAVAAEVRPLLADPEPDTSTTPDQSVPLSDVKEFRTAFGQLVGRLPDGDAVIVFIDDLDRCLPETVVDTFEAIRLFLNTPRTAYVLALNQNVVESAIDSRYPELTKPDGAGLGRDYLEKMIQIKVAIPPLSAPEAETYVNLLFAELRLEPDMFTKALDASNANRAAHGLTVAFNLGIAGEVLGNDLPSTLADDLTWAADIAPVLGSSLRGNPRQLKRFLNNLMLKHRSAARRKVELKLPVLAKLMVLEDQFNSDFQKLFDWEMAAGGKCRELAEAEGRARSASNGETDPSQTANEVDGTIGAGSGTKSGSPTAKGSIAAGPTEAVLWADKVHIGEWLRVEPSLRDIDLRPYFTYSRDKLSFGVSGSRLAPHLQQLLNNVQSDVESARRSQYVAVKALEPAERAQLVEALLERVQRQPASTALTTALELAEQNPDILLAVCEALSRIPPASIPTTAGTAAVRRLPADQAAVVSLLDYWRQSDNGALKTVVEQAHKARARKGTARGNVG